jgi:two-component sensor histidine kinase
LGQCCDWGVTDIDVIASAHRVGHRGPVNLVDQSVAVGALPKEAAAPRRVGARRHLINIGIGLLAAEIAVLVRYALNLPPEVLPFLLVVIAICFVTVFAGLLGGATTMIAGGLLTWYYLLDPSGTWRVDGPGAITLLGYFSVGSVILATSQLYRLSEQKRQAAALDLARAEADHQRLFAREMAHRLKNAMAIVQAMAGQTFPDDTPEVGKFTGRLKALADAHNLLNEHVKQPTASIDEVVETAIAPFRDRGDRFRLSGPPLPLPDQQVVSLTLALHELGTNAVKYGALSHAHGWVSIEWDSESPSPPPGGEGRLTPDPIRGERGEGQSGEGATPAEPTRLRLEWKEHDGPPVKTPTTKGFGSRLLARAAMGAKVRYEKDGLRCTITSGRA